MPTISNASVSVQDLRPGEFRVILKVAWDVSFTPEELDVFFAFEENIGVFGQDPGTAQNLFKSWHSETVSGPLQATMHREVTRSHAPPELDEDPWWQAFFDKSITPIDEIFVHIGISPRAHGADAVARMTHEFG